MKLATPFQLHCKYEDVIDEWNINYNPYKYTETDKLNQAAQTQKESPLLFEKLVDFIIGHSDKRINISFTGPVIPLHQLKTLKKISDNVYIKLSIYQTQYVKQFQENDIKFFFDNTVPVSTLTFLDALIKIGVTDVYIADDLCYKLPRVSKACKKNNVQIRLILNRIPTTAPNIGEDIRHPIFTPRHYYELDKYIDVAEFDCFYENESDAYNWSVFKVLYKAWFKKHDWWNDLREINKDVKFFYPVRQELESLIQRKVDCGHRCVWNDRCHKCDFILELAKDFYDSDLYIKQKKHE